MSKKTVEERYKKLKDQHEHILLRPTLYIGDIKNKSVPMWIYNEEKPHIVSKVIDYIPGFYKIFDEILVNARDHVVRCREDGLELCTSIKVTIDQDEGRISVWNNGAGIPIVEHKEHKMLIPSLIFGELLTSSNYDDDEKKSWWYQRSRIKTNKYLFYRVRCRDLRF